MMADTKIVWTHSAGRPLKSTHSTSQEACIIVCLGARLIRKLKAGLVVAFLVGLLVLFAHPDYRQGEPSLRGRAPKDFELTLNGKPAHLSDLRGKVVLVNFWATWCPPCVDEAPSLNALQHRITPRGGTVVGVSVDEDQIAYEEFLKTYGISFPTYRDPGKGQLAKDFGTTMYPETYVIGRNGLFDRKIVGPQDWSSPEMTTYLNSLLQEK
jgi:cytochrome c biogenesis protein CcmG/thiol:disulfide interchange protein DsbE